MQTRLQPQRLRALLDHFPSATVLVVGDFFLDKYLDLDPRLSEPSLETGLDAYQVVGVRTYPGAAGTVVNNLRALDVNVRVLGVIGEDQTVFPTHNKSASWYVGHGQAVDSPIPQVAIETMLRENPSRLLALASPN